ncbi:MAG TPA: hypothetical protein VKS82_00580 [Streptosporangiaceae bacterium]|nr:hypothetical protein [Streptosporangiaceae bacterium]
MADAVKVAGPAAAGGWLRSRLRRDWHLVVLAGWAVAWFVILAHDGGIAWKFFVQGTDLLFSGHDGASKKHAYLHIYATYPQLQIGPVAYLAAGVLRQIGPDFGVVAAEIVMTAMGLLMVVMIQRVAVVARPELAGGPGRRRLVLVMLTAGALFVVAWAELAGAYGHLDDAIALTCAVGGVWIWVAGKVSEPVRAALTGVAVGLAAAAKPWAFVFLPVILLPRWTAQPSLRDEVRVRLIAVGGVVAVTLAAWLPFFIADPATVNAMHYQIANMPDSALRALGVNSAKTPSWDRTAQVVLGCVLGIAAIARRRWAAVILLGAGARIALDPGVHSYYTPELMAGALLWDLLGPRRAVPVWSIACFAALNVTPLLTTDAAVLGDVRLGVIIAVTAAILLGPDRWYWRAPGQHRGGWVLSSAAQESPIAWGRSGGRPRRGSSRRSLTGLAGEQQTGCTSAGWSAAASRVAGGFRARSPGGRRYR